MQATYPAMARVRIYTTAFVADATFDAVCEHVGGATVTYARGGWRDDANGGRLVKDAAAVVELHNPDVAVLRQAINLMADFAESVGESEIRAIVDRDVDMIILSSVR